MSFSFGVQKEPIYGTYGEFTIGSDDNRVRAQFLLTKMKPGSEGIWENSLASQMVPWREVFNIEDLTFDELLQRDLDDSRVAHDLIPYLLGESGAFARFFPPILAVLVPKKSEKTGIESYYPAPRQVSELSISFGDLFDFEKAKIDGSITPLGVIKYNRQKTAFIIVDGQHRAMAVLALHRQINNSWAANNFAGFYNHLHLTENQIKNIELPICIVFFPDLHNNNEQFKQKGISLPAVCREIFLVVNKNAKPVSQSRELLLDDEDLAARMMRKTLSKLKGRGESDASIAHIYSFAFGDSVSEAQHRRTEVVAGQLEYTSAVALHKMHAAVAFGVPSAFDLKSKQDITDGRRIQNSERPATILVGTDLQKWSTLSRRSGRSHPPDEVEQAVELLGNVSDAVMLPLFDGFRPFAVHNSEMRALRTRLMDPDLRADPIQRKCYSLLFEGSGVRSVFEEHIKRLREREETLQEEGRSIGDYVKNQLKYAKTTASTLNGYENEIKSRTAARFFSIDYEKFFSAEGNEAERKELINRAKSIFDTVSTQAFQLGYLMAVHSVVELMLDTGTPYDRRLQVIEFVSNLYLNAMNTYFSSGTEVEHRTLKGFVNEPRAKVFAPNELGLRGLLAQSVKELNESQWSFFRYAILEMVHCQHAYETLLHGLNTATDVSLAEAYRRNLPDSVYAMIQMRNQYIDAAVNSSLNSTEFKQEIQLLRARCQGEGKTQEEIEKLISQRESEKTAEIGEKCKKNIKASLGEFAKEDKITNRLLENPTGRDLEETVE
ncbi:MAG: DNA sulfur modification protein DndB [Limnospira sp. PMC 1291.21]|uniref:DNA sulfur modification protein DndB n=1 Tax=unclassified Limnospira TaxID=2642885 RepID=UPI0028E0F6F9|nr:MULTISPECIES: DNA sulfur modification protein DndB [unclassified Limnospira]MDT9176809.1 DNA sulfur modification protein DndB [Limnospira sp. PMC 1238.20]MDT9192362.1 DNA sulfur modification protein DndB [Limnospira sp. PMC 1245.20]MDT9202426.1 DNA sulfur modification protein DndB [Limnospira sp. PMC 1243.20]MDT9207468.1 DNA sulfur modification protein DndB [Limnospira sp. PMC 1252.20]MDT9212775.1 DNA sulfur modification protein DndB [Limnospira sp. PMC 1256.20]